MRITKLFFAAAGTALAVFGSAGEDGALRVTALVNDVHKYTLSGKMTIASLGADATITGEMTQKVIKVEDNGNLTLQEKESITAEVAGTPYPQESISTSVMKPDGITVEIRGENAGPEAYRGTTIHTVKLPDFALEPDKTWTHEFPADAKTGVVRSKGEYKVLGSERLHHIETWKIHVKVTELEGDTPASHEGVVWIGKKDALLVKEDGKDTNLPIPMVGAVSGSTVIELVGGDDDAGK